MKEKICSYGIMSKLLIRYNKIPTRSEVQVRKHKKNKDNISKMLSLTD